MTEERERVVEISKNFVIAILNQNINIESANELYEINHDNIKVLLQHLKAITSIMNDAIKEIENKEVSK